MMRRAALAAVVLVLGGCEVHTPEQAAQYRLDYPFMGVRVEHDDSRGVTCWVTSDSRGGLSCLPDWMLSTNHLPVEPDKCLAKDVGKSEACRKLFTQPQSCTTAPDTEPCIDADGEMWPASELRAAR